MTPKSGCNGKEKGRGQKNRRASHAIVSSPSCSARSTHLLWLRHWDYSPWSEREIWPFLKGAKSQKPKRPYPPKIGAHAYLIILKVFVRFSMFTYPSLFTYCFESLNVYHNVLSSSYLAAKKSLQFRAK